MRVTRKRKESVQSMCFSMDALFQAVRDGNTEVVRLLLADPRVDPIMWNNYAIRMALENVHVEVVRLLLTDARVGLAYNTGRRALVCQPIESDPLNIPTETTDAITYDEIRDGDILVDFHEEWTKYKRCYKESSFKALNGRNPYTRQPIRQTKRYVAHKTNDIPSSK